MAIELSNSSKIYSLENKSLTEVYAASSCSDQLQSAYEISTGGDVLHPIVSLDGFVNKHIQLSNTQEKEDPFYIVDLSDVVRKFRLWRSKLSRVEPFYAVKCNDDLAVLQTLADLGTGFDCASQGEMDRVLKLGINPDRIIYANPCKAVSHIRFAAQANVLTTTFDNEAELHKMKRLYPRAQLVVRIRADDPTAVCDLGIKFGATLMEAQRLLSVAQTLNLNVIGVSFHVGSGCTNANAYVKAISESRQIFDHARRLNLNLTMLDIGGGFPGHTAAPIKFEEIAEKVSAALEQYFPVASGVRIIAEPGRFFVASAFTLCVNIIAKRASNTQQMDHNENESKFMYYVNDGVYGSFSCLLNDPAARVNNVRVPSLYALTKLNRASIWGPTCDSIDCIMKNCWLPEMETGQWLVFLDMGAYTFTACCSFNGFCSPYMVYKTTDMHLVSACDDD